MRITRHLLLSASILIIVAAAGCADLDPASPGAVDTGSADFSRYIALGNSLTAGYQSGGLVETFQKARYPALIARAAGVGTFEMPLISEPGIPPLMFPASLTPVVLDTLSGVGVPLNSTYAGIFNNLGIPGATLNQILTAGPGFPQNINPFFALVLRDQGLGATALEQAINFQPTFATVWLGANDVLQSMLKGSDQLMTPAASYNDDFRTLIDSLRAHSSGVVAANVLDITISPYSTTVPPILVDPITHQPILNPQTNQPIPLIGVVQGIPGPLPMDALVLLNAGPYIAQGIGIPSIVPGGTDIPLDDSLIVDAVERANIRTRVQEYNMAIDSLCANRNIPIVDMYSFFNDLTANGAFIRGDLFTTDYISGGLFTVDGLHPTNLGYNLVANEFIKVINASFNASLPGALIPVTP